MYSRKLLMMGRVRMELLSILNLLGSGDQKPA
jgi:hypothetical protein